MRMTNPITPLPINDGGSSPGIDTSATFPPTGLHRDTLQDAPPGGATCAPDVGAAARVAPQHLRAPKYRPDIDGLRAVAVTSVVAFHALPSELRGGFVGVDIFFVISGFLISTIIFESLEENRFSYIEFYIRRIRRIFPALLAVLTSCFVFGWFLLMPAEYRQLGKHMFGGSTFLSNVMLWREAGYFDNTAPTKPLLHLWSLGVEEQFYIFWPLLVSFVYRRRAAIVLLLGGVAAASLALNLMTSASDPTAAFYSPFTRFWELMIGAILAWVTLNKPGLVQFGARTSSALSAVGVLLIGTAIAFISQNDVFPGWRALLPTAGAFLIICAGPRAWFNRHVLGSRVAVSIGLISYPLYLWHWPLLSFANILEGGFVPVEARLALVLTSIVLAVLTYRYIELPIRATKSSLRQTATLCAMLVGFGAAGAWLFVQEGLPSRPVANNAGLALLEQDGQIRDSDPSAPCHLANPNADKFCRAYNTSATGKLLVIWGDSHGGGWLPAIVSIAKDHNMRLMAFVHLGCPPLLGTRRSDGAVSSRDCSRLGLAEPIVSTIQQLKPDVIFYISRWSLYGNGWTRYGELQKETHFITTSPDSDATLASARAALSSQFPLTVKALAASTRRLVVFQNPPELKHDLLPRFYAHPERVEPLTADHLRNEAFERDLVAQAASLPNVRVFDPIPRLCSGPVCQAVIDGVPLYEDDNHMSAQGALLFKQAIFDTM